MRPENLRLDATSFRRQPQPAGAGEHAPTTPKAGLSGDSYRATERARNARDFDAFLMNQFDGDARNACGTTSLSMLLNFWKGNTDAYNHSQIDKMVRRGPDMYSSPLNLRDYARAEGFRSEVKNQASLDDLKAYVDQGVPVQVLYDPNRDGGDATLHYVNVIDYEADAQGNVTDVVIADPAGGRIDTVPVAEFKERWDKLKFMNVPTGTSNLMIVTLPGENTPILGKDGKMRQSADIALPPGGNFWQRLLNLEGGLGVSMADDVSDLVNSAAKLKDTLLGGAKSLWKGLTGG